MCKIPVKQISLIYGEDIPIQMSSSSTDTSWILPKENNQEIWENIVEMYLKMSEN